MVAHQPYAVAVVGVVVGMTQKHGLLRMTVGVMPSVNHHLVRILWREVAPASLNNVFLQPRYELPQAVATHFKHTHQHAVMILIHNGVAVAVATRAKRENVKPSLGHIVDAVHHVGRWQRAVQFTRYGLRRLRAHWHPHIVLVGANHHIVGKYQQFNGVRFGQHWHRVGNGSVNHHLAETAHHLRHVACKHFTHDCRVEGPEAKRVGLQHEVPSCKARSRQVAVVLHRHRHGVDKHGAVCRAKMTHRLCCPEHWRKSTHEPYNRNHNHQRSHAQVPHLRRAAKSVVAHHTILISGCSILTTRHGVNTAFLSRLQICAIR